MASVDFTNTLKALDRFGSELKRRAGLALAVRRKRKRVRSSWEKGKPKEPKIRSAYRAGKGDSNLKKSLRYQVRETSKGFSVRLLSKPYWKNVEYGMKPFKERAATAKQSVNFGAIERWSASKKLQPRDLTTNKFLPRTQKNIDRMNFNIWRSISWFGIEPLPFTQEAVDGTLAAETKNLEKAVSKDIAENIKKETE